MRSDWLSQCADILNCSADYLLGRTSCPDINISGNTQNNINGIDTIEEYKANKAKITAEIERLKAQQKKPEPIKPELEKRRIAFNKMFDSGNMTPGELNAALKSFIAYIIYDRPNDKITLFLAP